MPLMATGDHMNDYISVRAPAKINLFLHVTGKRPDDYHEIASLVVFTSFGDTVAISPALVGEGIQFYADGPFADQMGPDPDNLVLRAAQLLMENCELPSEDVRIHLTKRLPVAAGIGGGSSDAAATLSGLIRYWELDLCEAKIMELGLELGADVPMCLKREPVLVSGIGDVLTPAPELPWISLVLVNPLVAVPTPAVFKARTGDFSPAMPDIGEPETVQDIALMLKDRSNNLTEAAVSIAPEIAQVLDALDTFDDCLLARMSGSGATCFGLFSDSFEAGQAKQTLHQSHPNWWVESMSLF
jgi:4-diphosphocytidyl-2-C-methyl-D-erythritol kinase